ncbi:hypothetical protein [uncultured Oscillibacter sp.]|jgi:hypothetical protein|uniref:hypothetical protein n=1 Tax=uncultured Oscillibacter sp. TaxID=876091 RepID=UPI0025CFBDBF|nr:hypothetical protein [uncultured Oscillibacter sp.]
MIGGISGVGGFGMGSVGAFYPSRLSEHVRNTRGAQQAQVWTARKSASPEAPVEPVSPVRPVSRDEASLPELTARLENDPAAMAGRMRTRYGEVTPEGLFVETGKDGLSPVQGSRKNALEGQLFQAEEALGRNDLEGAEDVLQNGAPKLPGLPGQEEQIPGLPGQEEAGEAALGAESAQDALKQGECETCEKRKYQDGSDDMGVSYQTPTNIKPEQAASAVRGHEMEHVYREQAKADREGRKVVSQSVTMHSEICPECGKSFVSGGTTRTVTKAETDNAAQQEDRQNEEEEKARTPFSAVA